VSAENLAVFFAEEDFDKAFSVANCLGFSDGLEGEFTDFVIDAFFLEGAFGFTNRGNFWVSVGAAGEVFDRLRSVAFNE